MKIRAEWWVPALAIAALGATEWLREPARGWAWAVAGTCAPVLGLLWVARRQSGGRRPAALATGLSVVALSVVILLSQRNLDTIDTEWPAYRESEIQRASKLLGSQLHGLLGTLQGVVARAAVAARGDQDLAFGTLSRASASSGPELAVAILDPSGAPWAWAGRHWVRPALEGDSIDVRSNSFWMALEVRRGVAGGRVVVANALLWGHPAVASQARALSTLFAAQAGVDLEFYSPGAAPHSLDVFDYEEPTTAGPRLLFSVRPVPAEQGATKEKALTVARARVACLLLVVLVTALLATTVPASRYGLLVLFLWMASRTPLGAALGYGPMFSPATYFHPSLGPLSNSAGLLALAGIVAAVAGVALWERRMPRNAVTLVLGAGLLLGAPYLISELGRGITPPAGGVRSSLWFTWEVAMVFPAAACVAVAAALFRGREPRDAPAWRALAGAGLAVAVTLAGVALWGPGRGWRDWEWYPLLWALPLFLVALPAPRWAMIAGLGVVAGSAAALVTWGEDLNGRLQVAERDVAGLGRVEDPQATPVLEQFAQRVRTGPPLARAADLYAVWRGSGLEEQRYPTRMALWSAEGAPQAELGLDSLDLPTSLVSALVRNLNPRLRQEVLPIFRVPGIHYVLLYRLRPDVVLSVAIGPRTRLIAPDRSGRLLRPPLASQPLYDLTLSPPVPGVIADSVGLHWRREDWELLSERRLYLPGGLRHVHARIDLRGPIPLLVRGALVVAADTAALALLWWLALWGSAAPRGRIAWRRLARSFQGRLALTLALFFVLPAAGLTAWNLARLRADAQRGRDLLITQALRDAVLAAGGLLLGSADLLPQGLNELGNRLDADLALYSGGALVASSSPLLEDLGLIDELMDPGAFQAVALGDELDVTRTGISTRTPLRVGYRVVQPGPPDSIGVLATPQPAGSTALRLDQIDLALLLLVASLAGIVAAVAGAQATAQALSRPVATLHQSALAVGRGLAPVQPATLPPIEFEAVFGAFDRMVADIRASQAALEEARRRTASVLATVATGVIAVDDEGRVLLANARAEEILGVPLREGASIDQALPSEWQTLQQAVRDFRPPGGGTPVSTEFEVDGRRLRLQLTALSSVPGGAVLALDDLTEVTKAERVLAWGEMARQIAHEIKNPLTPIRLGVQHLRRAYRDRRGDFEHTLDDTAGRILGEIDRLDTIARAFSRFAAPPTETAPLESVDLVGAAREVAQLYSLSDEEEGARVRLEGATFAAVPARRNEVQEVLVNLIENARNAGARRIAVSVEPGALSVEDDGGGIPAELLPRIFEPKFSSTTSGSGLGLAIVRRLVTGWGATIEVASQVGRGTRVLIHWA